MFAGAGGGSRRRGGRHLLDKPAGCGGQLAAPAVKLAAHELGLTVIQPTSARTGELASALRASGAELAVVVAYGKILPRAVLDAMRAAASTFTRRCCRRTRRGTLQWAVIDGQRETGVAIMQLDEGMDTGPVFVERRVAIDPDETSGEVLARLAPIGADALLAVIAEPRRRDRTRGRGKTMRKPRARRC